MCLVASLVTYLASRRGTQGFQHQDNEILFKEQSIAVKYIRHGVKLMLYDGRNYSFIFSKSASLCLETYRKTKSISQPFWNSNNSVELKIPS